MLGDTVGLYSSREIQVKQQKHDISLNFLKWELKMPWLCAYVCVRETCQMTQRNYWFGEPQLKKRIPKKKKVSVAPRGATLS